MTDTTRRTRGPLAWGLWIGGLAVTIALLLAMIQWCQVHRTSPTKNPPDSQAPFTFTPDHARHVGAATCAPCHQTPFDQWLGSHHDLAMQVATQDTVLGDFDDATFTDAAGVTTRFTKRDGKFLVHTPGADGQSQEYEVAYVFGVEPLQQILIPFPGGRYQALTVCWDTRPATDGGQRWFSLYPDQAIGPGDELHWTGPNFTWNYMCAQCHSTNLNKGYDLDTNTYHTTWDAINVSCEACHGPGSEHLRWAEQARTAASRQKPDPLGRSPFADLHAHDMGLTVELKDRSGGQWIIDPDTHRPSRTAPPDSQAQLTTCAPCHARRAELTDTLHGADLLDTHLPSLLIDPLYHADGQIQDEVYVYGSFLQSKMHHAGVRCTDCHNPHSLQLHAPGDNVCARCHLPDKYNTPTHHHHAPAPPDPPGSPGSPGSSCIACHMPQTTYMGVDDRADHSLRIPRPDLALKLGTPDACTQCHTQPDHPHPLDTQALAAAFKQDFPPPGSDPPGAPSSAADRYAPAFELARRGHPGAGPGLIEVAQNPQLPAIVRATALQSLTAYLTPQTLARTADALSDPDALIRATAVSLWDPPPPQARLDALGPLLSDPVRAVRIEAARILAGEPETLMDPATRTAFDAALTQYIQAQHHNADRGAGHHNLALLHHRRGQLDDAQAAYLQAIRIEPAFAPAYVNLADLHRQRGDEDRAQAVLRQGLAAPLPPDGAAALHHALGLTLIRQHRTPQAVASLAQATALAPDNAQFVYVYAVALESTGDRSAAIDVLEQALKRHPYDRNLRLTTALYCRDDGRLDAARIHARYLAQLHPNDPQARALLQELGPGP